MAHSVKKDNDNMGEKFRKHFEDFINITEDERVRAEKRRDYRDLKQWTAAQTADIERRGQAAIVFDHFGKKVDGLVGLEVTRRSDPKAYPVNPADEKASKVITDALRYVEANTNFDEKSSEVFEDKIVEGYGGVSVGVEEKNGEFVITVDQVPWDRIYFDPHGRERDFSDCSFFGITLWKYVDEVVRMFPDKEEDIRNLSGANYFEDETFEDRPRDWVDASRDRVRLNQEYFLDEKGVWTEVFYSGNLILRDPKPSPYEDEDGNPTNPIVLESDFLDRDNNRYGYSQRLVDVQDEINHRRSKALFMLSSKTVVAERGAFLDKSREQVLSEMRKGMSFLEIQKGAQVDIDSQQEFGQSQLAFYQDALNAVDSVGVNPELAGRTDTAISGRAFLARQQGGMTELARIFSRHNNWKKRVYNQIWLRVRQYWTEEKWMRVTDDENAMKFVGINVPVTRVEKELEQQSGMDINKLREINRDQVDQAIQQTIAENPAMGEVVETRNDVKKLNMDIVIEEAPDTATLQQEEFETLAQLAGSRADPKMFNALVMASSIRNKEQILEKLNGGEQEEQATQQAAQAQQQIQQAMLTAQIENLNADTAVKQSTMQKNMADVPLKAAQTADEKASAMERISKVSAAGLPSDNNGL
jgi:hypothetical protein